MKTTRRAELWRRGILVLDDTLYTNLKLAFCIGNLAWALQRDEGEDKKDVSKIIKLGESTAEAIRNAMEYSDIVLVYLNISPETVLRRRAQKHFVTSHLPFENEENEAIRLHDSIGQRARKLVEEFKILQDLNLPVLDIQNDIDGNEAIESTTTTVKSILDNLFD